VLGLKSTQFPYKIAQLRHRCLMTCLNHGSVSIAYCTMGAYKPYNLRPADARLCSIAFRQTQS
jgi:hypothetical protein